MKGLFLAVVAVLFCASCSTDGKSSTQVHISKMRAVSPLEDKVVNESEGLNMHIPSCRDFQENTALQQSLDKSDSYLCDGGIVLSVGQIMCFNMQTQKAELPLAKGRKECGVVYVK